MPNTHLKKMLYINSKQEIQIEPKRKCHFIPIKVAKISDLTLSRLVRICDKPVHLYTVGRSVNWYRSLENHSALYSIEYMYIVGFKNSTKYIS